MHGEIAFCGKASTSHGVLRRPPTREENGEIFRRLDSLEEDIKNLVEVIDPES